MENSFEEGECPPQGSRPCTGGVPLGDSKLGWRAALRAVVAGLVEVGLVQHRVVVVRPVLPDERRYAAWPPGPKGSGARLGEADEAIPGR